MSTFGALAKPFVLDTSLTVITPETSAEQARIWTKELEARYDHYYQDADGVWSWNDIHDLDRDVLIELEEVIRASGKPPLDLELVSSFRTPDWRKPYLGK